jgi:hypothetical protein
MHPPARGHPRGVPLGLVFYALHRRLLAPWLTQSYMHPQSSMLCIEDWVAPWLYGLWLCHIMAEP